MKKQYCLFVTFYIQMLLTVRLLYKGQTEGVFRTVFLCIIIFLYVPCVSPSMYLNKALYACCSFSTHHKHSTIITLHTSPLQEKKNNKRYDKRNKISINVTY